MSLENFVNAIESGNFKEAEESFQTELQARMVDAIDSKRQEVGAAISASFNGNVDEE